eukprot:g1361.t1
MRALGYPRLISVENFRNPNFALVADSLYWLVHRYDPHVRISDDIESEDDRIHFLTSIVNVMSASARIKLNAKRLYAADGRAVKELLKIATLLYKAHRVNTIDRESKESGENKNAGDEYEQGDTDQAKLAGIQSTRKLAGEITDSGAKLYDLLANEDELRAARENALRFLDATGNSGRSEHEFIDKSIRGILANMQEEIGTLEKQCSNLENDEKKLEKKIKKKKADLERSEKRLKSLKKVRPAFMDDFEKLENELKRQYEIYLERFRNLDYLESQLDRYNNAEAEELETAARKLKSMQERMRRHNEHLERGTFSESKRKVMDNRPGAAHKRYRDGKGENRLGRSESDKSLSDSGNSDSSDTDGWGDVSVGGSGGGSSVDDSDDTGGKSDGSDDDGLSLSDDDVYDDSSDSNEF